MKHALVPTFGIAFVVVLSGSDLRGQPSAARPPIIDDIIARQ